MIPVSVFRLSLSTKGPVVLLKGTTDPRTLPIFIGTPEAQAIAVRMEGIAVPRPLTHDLLHNVLESLAIRLKRVEISELNDSTFFARLILDRADKEVVMDARPSDAIALALRSEAPIFVAAAVMQQAGIVLQDQNVASDDDEGASVPDLRSAGEKLKQRLAKAIDTEDYEAAARIRDQLKELEKETDHN